jgi:hypothetical protein
MKKMRVRDDNGITLFLTMEDYMENAFLDEREVVPAGTPKEVSQWLMNSPKIKRPGIHITFPKNYRPIRPEGV